MIKKLPTLSRRDLLTFILPLTSLLLVLSLCMAIRGAQQFSAIAQSFLHGHTYFTNRVPSQFGMDGSLWHGKYYWAEGPFPALILMPFIAVFNIFNVFFYQGYLQWLLVLGAMFFVFKLARILRYQTRDSLILALGFTLGSVFIGLATVSTGWYFAQVVTTFLLLWSLYEFYTHKRWWLIGVICGFIVATRISAAPILIFFALEAWQGSKQKREQIMRLVQLGLPVLGTGVLLGVYNFIRFHNPLESGYGLYQLIPPYLAKDKANGILSLVHVPTNFFLAFLSAPYTVFRDGLSSSLKFPYIADNPWGMSIFITSPYLLYFFTLKRRWLDGRSLRMLAAILVSLVLVLSFFGTGYYQFGYRYSMDFMPLLFVLFMYKYRENHSELSNGMKFLLLGSGIFNTYLLMTYIGAW